MVWSITRVNMTTRITYHSKVRTLRCNSIFFHVHFDRKMCHIRHRIYRCGNHDVHVEFCSRAKRSPRLRNRRGRKRCPRVHSKPDWNCGARCGRDCEHAGSFGSPTHHRRVRYLCVHSCFFFFTFVLIEVLAGIFERRRASRTFLNIWRDIPLL
jgi:hypothetical protein